MEELTHEIIWRVLDHLRDFCTCRDNCNGCFYSTTYGNPDGDSGIDCAIHDAPYHWQTHIVKLHVEAEEEGDNDKIQ